MQCILLNFKMCEREREREKAIFYGFPNMFTQKNPHQHGRVKPEVVPKISPTMFVSFSYFEFSTVATHSQSI